MSKILLLKIPKIKKYDENVRILLGICHYRYLNALYFAMWLNSLNPSKDAVAEIGGRLGLTAMYAYRFGCETYAIYDLPITCTFIDHYLIHALGEGQGGTLR